MAGLLAVGFIDWLDGWRRVTVDPGAMLRFEAVFACGAEEPV